MQHLDRMTDQTVAQICAVEPFRGARVAEFAPLHQRSLCYRLRFTDGRTVFVKRALPSAIRGFDDSVAQEAAVLTRLRGLAVPAPRLLLSLGSPESPVLVTEDVAGRGSLEDGRQETGGTSPPGPAPPPARWPRCTRPRQPTACRGPTLPTGWSVPGPSSPPARSPATPAASPRRCGSCGGTVSSRWSTRPPPSGRRPRWCTAT